MLSWTRRPLENVWRRYRFLPFCDAFNLATDDRHPFGQTQELKEKEEALRKSEKNVAARDKVINELRLRLPSVVAGGGRLPTDTSEREGEALKLVHKTVKDLQGRLDKKDGVLKKYQNQLSQAVKVRWYRTVVVLFL